MPDNNTVSLNMDLQTLFGTELAANVTLSNGIANLAALPPLAEVERRPMTHKAFEKGAMGFRRQSKYMSIAVACGKAMVRHIDLRKFVSLVEMMNDENKNTIMLENFSDSDESRAARGQVLGRIHPLYSAICIVQGLTGRVIRSDSDIVRYDVYYLDRDQLASFYLSSKYQLKGGDDLENMISTYSGWVEYDVPLGLCTSDEEPYGIS